MHSWCSSLSNWQKIHINFRYTKYISNIYFLNEYKYITMVPILQLVKSSHHPYILDVVQSKEYIYEIYVESCDEDMNLTCMFWNLEQQPIKLKTLSIFHFQLPQICMCIGLTWLVWFEVFFSLIPLFIFAIIDMMSWTMSY